MGVLIYDYRRAPSARGVAEQVLKLAINALIVGAVVDTARELGLDAADRYGLTLCRAVALKRQVARTFRR